jgi:large subunit ribosomal protein L13
MGYTASAKSSDLQETWYVIDATDKVLGQLAADIATVLRGKHLPNFTPHIDMRTHVVVLNADKIHLTGRKWGTKLYRNHSLWRGGLRTFTARELNERKPGELVRRAVWGMLPKNRLGEATMTHLRIYSGSEHPHTAQKPAPMPVRSQKAEVAK